MSFVNANTVGVKEVHSGYVNVVGINVMVVVGCWVW